MIRSSKNLFIILEFGVSLVYISWWVCYGVNMIGIPESAIKQYVVFHYQRQKETLENPAINTDIHVLHRILFWKIIAKPIRAKENGYIRSKEKDMIWKRYQKHEKFGRVMVKFANSFVITSIFISIHCNDFLTRIVNTDSEKCIHSFMHSFIHSQTS